MKRGRAGGASCAGGSAGGLVAPCGGALKGAAVFSETPVAWVETRRSARRGVACAWCLAPAAGATAGSATALLCAAASAPAAERLRARAAVTCGCAAAYCSRRCRALRAAAGHASVCVGGTLGDSHPLAVFRQVAGASSEPLVLAAELVGAQLAGAEGVEAAARHSEPWAVACARRRGGGAELREELEDQTVEAYRLLAVGLAHGSGVAEQDIPTLERFAALAGAVERDALPLVLDSPLVEYFRGQEFHGAPAAARLGTARLLRRLRESLRERFAEDSDADESESGGESESESDGGGGDDDDDAPEPSGAHDPVTLERELAEFVQGCADELPMREGMGIFPRLSQVGHSCLPNCQFEACTGPDGVRLTLLALRDLEEGERLTVTFTSLNQRREERAADLAAKFPGFDCACARCQAESGRVEGIGCADLRRLANQALEEGRVEDAEAHLEAITRERPRDGDALHAKGVALLTRGDWAGAHAHWHRAIELAPGNPKLVAQKAKDDAYMWWAQGGTEPPGISPAFTREPGIDVFSSDMALLTEAECASIIAAAEEHARRSGGWTTSRHYAVPTTDLPIHDMPEVLAVFNRTLWRTLAPLLGKQFGVPAATVRVHDAFVVRYDASAQRALPEHTDESMFSVTIALNAATEYSGGGTWFRDLSIAVRPDIGECVSFKGDVVHAGTPITSGVRYVVAAFLYATAS